MINNVRVLAITRDHTGAGIDALRKVAAAFGCTFATRKPSDVYMRGDHIIRIALTETAACPRDTRARSIARDVIKGDPHEFVVGLDMCIPSQAVDWELDVSARGERLPPEAAVAAALASVREHVETFGG